MDNLVAERIQARMEELGKNPSSVALEAGLGRSSVRDILLGRVAHPRIDTLKKIAAPLKCTVDYLTGESDKPDGVSLERKYWFMDGLVTNPVPAEVNVFRKPFPDEQYPAASEAHSMLNVDFAEPRLPGWRTNVYTLQDNSLELLGIFRGDSLTGVHHPDDLQLPLNHGSLVAVRQSISVPEVHEISVRMVETMDNGIALVCRSKTDIPPIAIPDHLIDNESSLLPNYYPLEKTSVEILDVIVRVIREVPISEALYDLTPKQT